MEASSLVPPAGLATRRPGTGVLLRLRSDEQLVTLFRRGDEDAFRVIHDRYRQRLSAYARQMLSGSTADAEDAMQDVFLRAYGALRADDRPLTLRAWLYRVAHNRCVDHLRRPAAQMTTELTEASRQLESPTGDPLLALEQREDLRRLVTDVRALPAQQRSALLMREMEGLTYQELATALDLTMPAVKSVLVRARMGLVDAQQARDTPCTAIRADITSSHDRGVRATGRARRHMRECPSCGTYRATLRGITDGLQALGPATGPWTLLAKLIGLGAGGSGAAGGAAAAGSGVGAAGATGTLAAGGTAATVGTAAAVTKIAAVVCCAAVFGGGVEVARESAGDDPAKASASVPGREASAARAAVSPLTASVLPPGLRAAAGSAGPGVKPTAKPGAATTSPGAAASSPAKGAGPDPSLAPALGNYLLGPPVLTDGGIAAPPALAPSAIGLPAGTPTVDTGGPPLRLPLRPAPTTSTSASPSPSTSASASGPATPGSNETTSASPSRGPSAAAASADSPTRPTARGPSTGTGGAAPGPGG